MDASILVAIISASGSIIVASLTFYLTKKYQIQAELRRDKIDHYKVLLSSLSDLATDGIDKDDANRRFSLAANTIALVAPLSVINALMEFHDEIKYSNKIKTIEKHDELLGRLLVAIRKDIGFPRRDTVDSFNFHLIGSAPKK